MASGNHEFERPSPREAGCRSNFRQPLSLHAESRISRLSCGTGAESNHGVEWSSDLEFNLDEEIIRGGIVAVESPGSVLKHVARS